MTKDEIHSLLASIDEPIAGMGLAKAGIIDNIQCDGNDADIYLRFTYPAKNVFAEITAKAQPLLAREGVNARFHCDIRIYPRTVQGGVERLTGVKNIIAVSSAKGGVGKSTTTINLALALAKEGATVGVLDADVYGPSLPVMLGIKQRPQGGENGGIQPLIAHGMQIISIGFLVENDQAMIWRGPMATRAVTQLTRDTQWRDIDYLLLDMPPGTGDIQLTVAQRIPVTGAIIVTTPQELAVADARRGLVMFNKVSIPVLGIIENMSLHRCPNCQTVSHIFGSGGAQAMCEKYQVELLGELPLDINIRDAIDSGKPTLVDDPDGDISTIYTKIALRAAMKLAEKSRDRSAAFPKIVLSD